jgi:hypothetical protein
MAHRKEPQMIRAGDTIENPVTGERATFLKTSAETGGELVLIETTVAPDGFVAAEHIHPYQSERFEVLSGRSSSGWTGRSSRSAPCATISPRRSRSWERATA